MQSQQVTVEESSSSPLKQEQFEQLQTRKVKGITSASTSPHSKYILITTEQGFVLVEPLNTHFTRFEDNRSPFFTKPKAPCGARLGSVIESRTEVALIPNFTSKKYSGSTVYIFDYSIGIILSRFDFILSSWQLTLTDRFLVVSNNKRIVLYNYLKHCLKGTEKYYIDTYRSDQNTDFVRYLQLDCHLYRPEEEESTQSQRKCDCGKYSICRTNHYLTLFYLKVSLIQNTRVRTLYCYDEATDKSRPFQGIQTWTDEFQFVATQDGKYLAIAEDYGRRIRVFNLQQNILQTVLHLSRNPQAILNLGIITLPNQSEWVLASREKDNDEATMHLFKLAKTPPTEHVESNYKRYFRLYKQFSVDDGVFSSNFLPPQYYLLGQKIYSLALEGEYCELIDLGRSGLHERVIVKDYRRLEDLQAKQEKLQ